MATIKITLDIPLEIIVNGSKKEYIEAIKKASEEKYNHLNKVYGKVNLKD